MQLDVHPAAVIAGGQSRRMGGGEKFLLPLAGRPMLDAVLDRLAPQCDPVAIVANCDPRLLAPFSRPVVADGRQAMRGPLSGILAALDWASALPAASHVLTVAADTPFLPLDLAQRLSAAAGPDQIAVAASDGRAHPVFALWPLSAGDPLDSFLTRSDDSSVMAFLKERRHVMVEFAASPGGDPFFNVNTPADLETAEARTRLTP